MQQSEPDTASLLRWAEGWKLAGEFLDEARRLDLAAMDEAAGQRILRLLSSDERRPARHPRPHSGLMEQQRLFRQLAPR